MKLAALFLCAYASAAGAQTIVAADYIQPTERYPHGILGDKIEHAGLRVTLSDGRALEAVWSEKIVFEDTAPRLVDLDGDGSTEVIVVESHEDQGARLAVWGLQDGRLVEKAFTPFIGTPFRWLSVAGAADMDGDGFFEIAYIDRPHLVKQLKVWRYIPQGDAFVDFQLVATKDGLTNHQIGETDIGGGMRICADGVDVITANADWTRVMATRFEGGVLVSRDVGPHTGRASLTAAMGC